MQPSIQQGDEQVLLGLEVMVERSLANPRLVADIIHAGFIVSVDRELFYGCLKDVCSCLFASLLHGFPWIHPVGEEWMRFAWK